MNSSGLIYVRNMFQLLYANLIEPRMGKLIIWLEVTVKSPEMDFWIATFSNWL